MTNLEKKAGNRKYRVRGNPVTHFLSPSHAEKGLRRALCCVEADALIQFYQDEMNQGPTQIEIREPTEGPKFKVYEVEVSYTCRFTGHEVDEEKQ